MNSLVRPLEALDSPDRSVADTNRWMRGTNEFEFVKRGVMSCQRDARIGLLRFTARETPLVTP
jgi:hypothetical protein